MDRRSGGKTQGSGGKTQHFDNRWRDMQVLEQQIKSHMYHTNWVAQTTALTTHTHQGI